MTSLIYGQGDATFQAAGGVKGLQTLVETFYRIMDEADYAREIRDMHPKDLTETIDKLARFLSGWMGGPRRFQEKYGAINIPHVHSPYVIYEKHAEAWLQCMADALDELDYPQDFREYLLQQLAFPAYRIVQVSQHYHGHQG